MKKIFYNFLLKIFGWSIEIETGDISDKCVVAVYPHTSYCDGIIGFIAINALGLNYKTLAAKWLFKFPMKYVMKYFMHASPVERGTLSSIRASLNLFKDNDKAHLIVCPEGQLAPTDTWNMGFLYIAKKANVNIAFAIFDYKTKKISIVEITNVNKMSDTDMVMYIRRLSNMFPCCAKYPEMFKLPTVKLNNYE